ncbi:tset complex member tsta [Anaeramoeba ignava]|uniref:Tset complex member tsta n=1 Tax=Anaeramoeba ignava TaxID=1746090 RepID=A0A9Q0LS99_ANAIG|nr:tset complex member tsta [Anaeramoeba ignava]
MEVIELGLKEELSSKDTSKQLNSLTKLLQDCSEGKDISQFFGLVIGNCLLNEDTHRIVKILAYQILKHISGFSKIKYDQEWISIIPTILRDLHSGDYEIIISAIRCLNYIPTSILNDFFTKYQDKFFFILQKNDHEYVLKSMVDTIGNLIIFNLRKVSGIDRIFIKKIIRQILYLILDDRDRVSISGFNFIRTIFCEVFYNYSYNITDTPLKNQDENYTNHLKIAEYLSKKILINFSEFSKRFSCLNSNQKYLCVLPLTLSISRVFLPSDDPFLKENQNHDSQAKSYLIQKDIEDLVYVYFFPALNCFNDQLIFEICQSILHLAVLDTQKIKQDWIKKVIEKYLELLEREDSQYNNTLIVSKIIKVLPLLKETKQLSFMERLFPFIIQLEERESRIFTLVRIFTGVLKQTVSTFQIEDYFRNIKRRTPIKKLIRDPNIRYLLTESKHTFREEFVFSLMKCMIDRLNQPKYLIYQRTEKEKKNQSKKNIEKEKSNQDEDLLDLNPDVWEENKEDSVHEIFTIELIVSIDLLDSFLSILIWDCSGRTSAQDSLLRLCYHVFLSIEELDLPQILTIKSDKIMKKIIDLYPNIPNDGIKIHILYLLSNFIRNSNTKKKLGESNKEIAKKNGEEDENENENEKQSKNANKKSKKNSNDQTNSKFVLHLIQRRLLATDLKWKQKELMAKQARTGFLGENAKPEKIIDSFENPNYFLLFQCVMILSQRFEDLLQEIEAILIEFKSLEKNLEIFEIEHSMFVLKHIQTQVANLKKKNETQNKKSITKKTKIKSVAEFPRIEETKQGKINKIDEEFNFFFFRAITTEESKIYESLNFKNFITQKNEENTQLVNQQESAQSLEIQMNLSTIQTKEFQLCSGSSDPVRLEVNHFINKHNKRIDLNLKITNMTDQVLENFILQIHISGQLSPINNDQKSLIINLNQLQPFQVKYSTVPFIIFQLDFNTFYFQLLMQNQQQNTIKIKQHPSQIVSFAPYHLPLNDFLGPSPYLPEIFNSVWNSLKFHLFIDSILVNSKITTENLLQFIQSKPFSLIFNLQIPNHNQFAFSSKTWFNDHLAFTVTEIFIEDFIYRFEFRTNNEFVLNAINQTKKNWIAFISNNSLDLKEN